MTELGECVEVDAGSPAAQAAMTAYFTELSARFPAGFDPTGYLAPEDYNPPRGRFFLVVDGDAVLACGGLQWIDDETAGTKMAEIKRMWVAPAWRGRGLAGRLLRFLEQIAVESGRRTIRLDTNPVLLEAIAMYRKAGYVDIERYNENPYAGLWFEKTLPAEGDAG